MKGDFDDRDEEINRLENEKMELLKENSKLRDKEAQLLKEKQHLLISKDKETQEKEDANDKIASLEDRLLRLTTIQQAKEEEIVALANEKDSETKSTISNMEKKYKEMQDSMQTELDGLRNKLKKLNNSHFRVASAHKDLEFENKQLQNKDDLLQSEMSRLRNELEKYKKKYHESDEENKRLKDELSNLKEELLNEQKRNSELETEWTDKYESLDLRYESTTHTLTREIVKLTKAKMNVQKELNNFKKTHQEVLSIQHEEMTNMQTQLAFLKTVYDGVREKKRVAIGDTFVHSNNPHALDGAHGNIGSVGSIGHELQYSAHSQHHQHQSPRSGQHGMSPKYANSYAGSDIGGAGHRRGDDNRSYSGRSQHSEFRDGASMTGAASAHLSHKQQKSGRYNNQGHDVQKSGAQSAYGAYDTGGDNEYGEWDSRSVGAGPVHASSRNMRQMYKQGRQQRGGGRTPGRHGASPYSNSRTAPGSSRGSAHGSVVSGPVYTTPGSVRGGNNINGNNVNNGNRNVNSENAMAKIMFNPNGYNNNNNNPNIIPPKQIMAPSHSKEYSQSRSHTQSYSHTGGTNGYTGTGSTRGGVGPYGETNRQTHTAIRVHSQSDASRMTKRGTADPGGVSGRTTNGNTNDGGDDERAKRKKYFMGGIAVLLIIIIILIAT